MKVKEESEEAGLKLNIQNMKIMASGLITSWQIDGETMETVTDFTNKGLSSQSYGFSSSHVWMWELDHKESWAQKNWCIWTVVLEKTLESPLDCKEIKPVNPKGKQPWIFTGRTDAELQYFGHLRRRVDSLVKTLILGRIGGRRRRGRQRMRWLHGITDSMDMSE